MYYHLLFEEVQSVQGTQFQLLPFSAFSFLLVGSGPPIAFDTAKVSLLALMTDPAFSYSPFTAQKLIICVNKGLN